MKKSIKLKFLTLIFLFFATTVFAVPEHVEGAYDDIFLYAQSLHYCGAYEEAEVEYKRYIFMQSYVTQKSEYLTEGFCALAELYEKKQEWTLAAEAIQKAIVTLDQNEENLSMLEHLQCKHILFLKNEAEQSKQNLSDNLYIFSYMNLPEISETTKKYAYSAAIADAVSKGRIEYAQNIFNTATELIPAIWNEQQQEIIGTSLQNLMAFKPKNQKLAGYLSFFPGLGQLYAHDYKDSLNAFLLNGSIIAVSVWSLCTLDFWTFSLLEFDPIIRFMQGNIYNAQKDAYQYNLKKQQELSAPICEILQNAL